MKEVKDNSFVANILKNKKYKTITTSEALKDVNTINWGKEVISGEKKVVLTK